MREMRARRLARGRMEVQGRYSPSGGVCEEQGAAGAAVGGGAHHGIDRGKARGWSEEEIVFAGR